MSDLVNFECMDCLTEFPVKGMRKVTDNIVCPDCGAIHFLDDDYGEDGELFWYVCRVEAPQPPEGDE